MFSKKIAVNTDKEKINELLTRGVSEVIDKKHLEEALLSGKELRVKLGIDPTSPNIHLGRAVVLNKLKDFQDFGHQIVFIIGDFTGTVGDTSDKESERPMISEEVVKANMKEYAKQAGKILDLSKTEVHYNSKWLAKLDYGEIGMQADAFGLSDFIDRENIKKRLDAGKRVSLRETLYPLMQGYDSVAIKADVEIGGTDQKFNLLAGRTLQKTYKQKPQDILTMNLILGNDGRKMSSSWGNVINLIDSANDMFGKTMAIPDHVIVSYFIHCTRVSMTDIEKIKGELVAGANPRDIKMSLAYEIVKMYHGEKSAESAKKYFIDTFQKKETPDEMPEHQIAGLTLIDGLVKSGLAESKGDAHRLIEQKGIKINGTVATSPDTKLSANDIIQKGKRFFVRVI